MIKISEMAQLAHTTRRTLLYYDQQEIFKPKQKTAAGYRYYDYDQLYDLLFILSLKDLGVPLATVKQLIQQPGQLALDQLVKIQKRIDNQLASLTQTRETIAKIINDYHHQPVPEAFQPVALDLPRRYFWCSPQAASCTDKEVAQLFANFYQHLGPLAVISSAQSGYLTQLALANPAGYSQAAFRVIKEATDHDAVFPMISKPAGKYVAICVPNSREGVQAGLSKLRDYCQLHHFQTDTHLWQINTSNRFNSKGASKRMWLEYRIE